MHPCEVPLLGYGAHMRRTLGPVLLLVGVLTLVVATGSSAMRAQDRPDLKVTKGSVVAGDGSLTGSFFVRNKSDAGARSSRAALTVQAPGQDPIAERFKVAALDPKETYRLDVAVPVPSGLPEGSLPLVACVDVKSKLRERKEDNNCATVGSVQVGAGTGGSSVPANPIPFDEDQVFTLDSSASRYWVYVPNVYDETHVTATTLFVWMHGCGGTGEGDIYVISPGGSQDWISVAVGGREGGCWDPAGDQSKIFAAISDMKSHFNIDPRRVILGGYSSGGIISTASHSRTPTRSPALSRGRHDPVQQLRTGPGGAPCGGGVEVQRCPSRSPAGRRFPIANVRAETEAMRSAGFPVERIERSARGELPRRNSSVTGPRHHADIQTFLLSRIDDGWRAPAQ